MTADIVQKISFIEAGLIEILGSESIQTKTDTIQLKAVKDALAQQLGEDAASGLLVRAGRAAFHHWMRQNAAALGWREVEFRLLPAPARIRRSLSALMDWLNREGALKAALTDSGDRWQVRVAGLTEERALFDCSTFLGILQEACTWAGSGKFYPSRESACKGTGAPECLFEIEKKSAD
mgnify:CR=1 FL=1